MIKPENYQILAAKLSIDLMRTERQKLLPPMVEYLRELLLQLNEPSPNFPDDQTYAQKRNSLRDAGNRLWQKLNVLTDAMITGASPEVHKQALTEASAALELFDRSYDRIRQGRSHEQFLLDSAARSHCGSVIVDYQEYEPVQWTNEIKEKYYPAPGSDKKAEPLDNNVRAARYLYEQLKPEPYQPGNAENLLQDQEPAPPIAQQLEQNAKPKSDYRKYRDVLAADTRHNLKTRLAAALAAVELEGKGGAFDGDQIRARARDISQTLGFQKLIKSKNFVSRLLREPDNMSILYKAYTVTHRYEELKQDYRIKENYDIYRIRHQWQDVPKGKEREYLAKLMAADYLHSKKEPFNKDKIHALASAMQKDRGFKRLTRNVASVRKMVEEGAYYGVLQDYLQMDAACYKRRMADFQEHPEQLPEKCWERYMTQHLVAPPQGKEAEYLSKVLAAWGKIRLDSPNDKFSVKTARSFAAEIRKRPEFRAMMQNPQRIRTLLQNGNISELSGMYLDGLEKHHYPQAQAQNAAAAQKQPEAPQAGQQIVP